MAELKIKADSGGGTVSFKGPATTTSNAAVQLTLPVDDGTADQFLKTNGSGALSWAAAGSPSIDDNGDATAMTIDSSENIGIGTATPSSWNSDADNLVINSSGNAGITINTGSAGSTAAGNLVFAEGTAGDGDKYRGAIKYTHGSDNFTFHVNNAEKMELQSDGDLKLESGNVIINTAGKGILFHSHAAANNLDDYEEGTWTPVFSGASNLGSYSHQDGYYIKVGRVCHAWYYVRVDRGTSTSNAKIFGLPFDADHESVIWPVRHAYGGTAVHNIWGECQNNGDWIRFFRQDGTLTDTTNYYWDFGYVNANAYVALSGTITYRTD